MADLQLQPSIFTDLRSQAHLSLINRLQALDLSPILVYRIASLVDSAVLAMAWQWDVLNPLLLPAASQIVTAAYPSWDQIQNIDQLVNLDLQQYQTTAGGPLPLAAIHAQYRALILLSTSLHSINGTPQALLNALAGLGYRSVTIQEGQNSWGGTEWPPNEGWAVFRVLIDLAQVPADLDLSLLIPQTTAICNYWKPARCWLDGVQFTLSLSDPLLPAVMDSLLNIFLQQNLLFPLPLDLINTPAWPVSDTKTIVPLFNQRYYFGSDLTFGSAQPALANGPVIVNGGAVNVN